MRSSSLLTLLVIGCSHSSPEPVPAPAGAVLRDATGKEVGTVALRERGDRVEITVSVNGLMPGSHGMHLHEIGRCQAPAFQSAGSHLNPGGTRRHGHRNPQGHHLGDLGNLAIGATGAGERMVTLSAPRSTGGVAMLLGGLGRTLVVHANPDDELSQPEGKSGVRIACAELSR